MHDTAKANDLAREEIDALEKQGIKLTLEEIVEINALGWAVQSQEARRHLARGRPVIVGGVWLWPLTIRAASWLVDNRFPLDSVTPAMGYAMAFGRSDGHELDIVGNGAIDAVESWYKSLRITKDEFVEAVKQVDDQDAPAELPPDPTRDGERLSLGDLCAFLCACCGADADFWERRCSMTFAMATLTAFVTQNQADGKSSANDQRIMAERALGWAVEKIKARHVTETAEAAGNG